MGQQKNDAAIVGSSLVLLQERFRQLQRLKEMREGKQLLRLLPQQTDGCDASMMGFPTADRDPLALGLNPCFRVNVEVKQFGAGGGGRGPHGFFEKPDVDTSLRL